jgi:hypothetical protein
MPPNSLTRQSPRKAGFGNNLCLGGPSEFSTNLDPFELVCGKLDGLRRSANEGTSKCPSHEDRSASLSIRAGADGRVLLHCFAGCSAADVVEALGLQLADLFVRKSAARMSIAERAAFREHGRQSQWRAALNVVNLEAIVVQIAAKQMLAGRPLSKPDYERLVFAATRIDDSVRILNAR